MKIIKKNWLLIIILFFAAFFRFYHLDQVPTSLHTDEAVFGYNAYSILKTGTDEYGHRPLFVLESFADFRPALYLFLTIPSVAVFGLTEFAVRFPTALISLLTVILFYFLSFRIVKNKEISLVSTALMAFSFWHLNLSREASEKVLALFLFLLGFFFLLIFIEKAKRKWLFLSFLSWFLSLHAYYAPRFFLPFFMIILFFSYRQTLFKKEKKMVTMLAALLLFSIVYFSFFYRGSAIRFQQLNVFSHPEVRLVLEEQIREEIPGTSPIVTRFFHNKLINHFLEVLEKYSEYLTLKFLVFKGGEPLRVAVPNTGLLSIIEIPFLLLGIYFLIRERKNWAWLIVFWLLLAPLPASFTVDETPSVYRSLVMLPALNLAAAFGFVRVKELMVKKKKGFGLLLIMVAGVFYLWNFTYYAHQYYVHQRFHRPWHRHYGYKQLAASIENLYPDYEKIVITKAHASPYIFLLFYLQFDPAYYQSLGSPRDLDYSGFDKYRFSDHDCPSHIKDDVMADKTTLFVDKGECETRPYFQIIKTVKREDNTPVFQLGVVDKAAANFYFKKMESLNVKE